jgi:hypothetical protein
MEPTFIKVVSFLKYIHVVRLIEFSESLTDFPREDYFMKSALLWTGTKFSCWAQSVCVPACVLVPPHQKSYCYWRSSVVMNSYPLVNEVSWLI